MRLLNFTEELRDRADDFWLLHPKLQAVIFDAAVYAFKRFGKTLLITSMFRNDGGVHQYGRGVDIDVCQGKVYEGGLTPLEAEELASDIDTWWVYDPKRQDLTVVVYKLEGEAAKKFGAHKNHIHFQVHGRTVAI
jgi:hypothetical protein